MKKLTPEIYKKLYSVFHGLFIAFAVLCAVLSAFAVLALFLDISLLGEIHTTLEFGLLEITPAAEYLPDGLNEKAIFIVSLLVEVVNFGFACVLLKIICDIIKPLTEGEGYGTLLSAGLLKLSKVYFVGGIIIEIANLIGASVLYNIYNVESLLLSEKITQCVMNYNFNGNNIVIAAVLFLLSQLFAYGEELQRQVDETL